MIPISGRRDAPVCIAESGLCFPHSMLDFGAVSNLLFRYET
ncbi:MAG: hypothetical protein J07HR59_00444 [Halorubrum sp. J07HR59]|nr:MAG: hypothetical protein J07HR59_00444 [Halorubrum sp. J07HR59]